MATTTICATPFKLAASRFTLLDQCGVPVSGASSVISVTGSLIEAAEAQEWEDQEEFFTKNGVGQFCTKAATAPIYKYSNWTVTLCNVDPELVNMVTANAIVQDDSTTPQNIGNRLGENDATLNNFAFEGWTLLTNKANCTTGFQYGYFVTPWCIQGRMSDITYGNNVVNCVFQFRTQGSSPWDVGPYNVNISNATATPGLPLPLLTPYTGLQHKDWHLTALAPPPGNCGTGPLAFTVTVVGTVHTSPVTLTFPTPANLPAMINWGDMTTPTTVTTGTDTTHTYAAAGTYTVTYNLLNQSHQPYVGTVTVT